MWRSEEVVKILNCAFQWDYYRLQRFLPPVRHKPPSSLSPHSFPDRVSILVNPLAFDFFVKKKKTRRRKREREGGGGRGGSILTENKRGRELETVGGSLRCKRVKVTAKMAS